MSHRAVGLRRILGAPLAVVTALAIAGAAAASPVPPGTPQGPLGYVPTYDDPMPAYAWQGAWQSQALYIASQRTGAGLWATVFAPKVLPRKPVPAVVILPGSIIGTQANYQWAARDLAGHGYVALTIDPEGEGHSQETAVPPCQKSGVSNKCGDLDQPAFFSTTNWDDALETGIGFLTSAQDPYRGVVDPSEIGAAGHSLGAAVVSTMQASDHRIRAIVAWDNLDGFGGDPCNKVAWDSPGAPTTPATPRVPALGEGSETCESASPTASGKLAGFQIWRSHHMSSMEVVFAGSQHLSFGQGAINGLTGTSTQLEQFSYYMRAWFDVFLKHDPTAISRLLSTSVDGTPRGRVLSTKYTSAAYLPQARVDCADLRTCAPEPASSRSGRRRGGARLSVALHPRSAHVDRAIRLTVRVTAGDGVPAAGAVIRVDGRRAVTDRQGIAAIRGLRFAHTGLWPILVSARGHPSREVYLSVGR